MTKVSRSVSGAVRRFSYWMANRSVGHPLLEGIDYSCVFEEPSALEQAYAIFVNCLELNDRGEVVNARDAEMRAAQFIRSYVEGGAYAVEPPFQDWEVALHEAASQSPASDTGEPRAFRTLRGFLRGEESDEPEYFHFSATLRIYGDGVPFDEIGRRLRIEPTHVHRKGERRANSPPRRDDAWHYQPPLPETEPPARHLEALWQAVRPSVDYLKFLKRRFKVDVFCGYRSNCDHAGFVVPHECLELFAALEVPFGVSVIIA
jgi:hypothetical protein